MIDIDTYKKEIVRMWDSMREVNKGLNRCEGVVCVGCPLDKACGPYNAFENIRIVEQWSKEHPIITNADKFKEVFGNKPINSEGYICPSFALGKCPDGIFCFDCEMNFWEAEYKAPAERSEE